MQVVATSPCGRMVLAHYGSDWMIVRNGDLYHMGTEKYIRRTWKEWERGNWMGRDLTRKYRKV